MKYIFVALLSLVFVNGIAHAQDPSQLTTPQAAIIYDQCLARAAQSASRTEAPPAAIYGMAKAACSQTRSMLLAGLDPKSEKVATLDPIDKDREATFPESTRKVREMRRQFEEKRGIRDNAQNN